MKQVSGMDINLYFEEWQYFIIIYIFGKIFFVNINTKKLFISKLLFLIVSIKP